MFLSLRTYPETPAYLSVFQLLITQKIIIDRFFRGKIYCRKYYEGKQLL